MSTQSEDMYLCLVLTLVKDVPAFHVAAGNPARIIRKIETSMSEES